MTIKRLIGTDPDQIPRNSDLGSMAFQDAAGVTVGKLKVNTSATLLGSTTGVAAGVYPLNISDGNTIAAGLQTTDWMVLSAQNTNPGFTGTVAGTGRMVFKGTKAGGTLASPTAPANNDEILSVLGAIYDGSTTLATAQITFKVDGTVSSGVAPQKIEFQTGATNSRTTRLTIGSTGTITAATPIVANDIVTINANSTSDALRITQTGAGNALVVEDSANPDGTPFLIDSSGYIVSGHTSAVNNIYDPQTPNARTIAFQKIGVTCTDAGIASISYATPAGNAPFYGAAFYLARSKSSTRGGFGAVSNGDVIGSITFNGDDGTNFVSAAQIRSYVDGIPGTNDMPGNLVFYTTPDASNISAERMRIGSNGTFGFGVANQTNTMAYLSYSTQVSGTSSFGVSVASTVQSGVTSADSLFRTTANTAAASFTLNSLYHYAAAQGTFGTGSTVTNQYGVHIASSLIGATYNYGVFSAIPAAANRWNFYAQGTAQNYFAGNTGIGGLPSGSYTLEVTGDTYISGNLTVNGSTTTINSTTISVDDKNIELGSVATPTDITAEGGGITLKGATDKTLNWVGANTAWTSSENFDLVTGKTYKINGTDVLSATTLGSGVVSSSLTSLGTLTGLTVNGAAVIGNTSGNRFRFLESNGIVYAQAGNTAGDGADIRFTKYGSTDPTLTISTTNSRVGIGSTATAPAATLDVQGDIVFKECRLDTGTTDITTTTQTTIAFFPSANIRTAEFLVQVVDSTNSQYHATKILVIHDGTNVNIVQYGVVHTANELGTFDADISGGNLRLRFTATAATTKRVKVVQTMIAA